MGDKMIPFCYVKELFGYPKEELKKKLGFTDDNPGFLKCVEKLKAYGVLKVYKKKEEIDISDLTDEEEIIEDTTSTDSSRFFGFKYVGIVTYGSRVICILPKYISKLPEEGNKDHSLIKQVVRVIEKDSHNDPQNLKLVDVEDEEKSFNYLALSLFLLEDYHENGVYRKEYNRVEINGEGEILWEKTINEGFAIIQNNRPYYTELYTRRSVNNLENFFRRLHECILTEISVNMEELRLNELLDIATVELSEITLEELEDREYIKELILKELNVEFNTRKQMLLKAMYVYLDQGKTKQNDDSTVFLYGTNSYNMVWERACGAVFKNQVKDLKKEIPFPYWHGAKAGETLRPDILTIQGDGDKRTFFILDAKYYNISINGDIVKNAPGVADLTKQYLYQLAFKNYLDEKGIKNVQNAFLFPSDGGECQNLGYATFEIFNVLDWLKNIQLIKLPADEVFDKYLKGETIDIDKIGLVKGKEEVNG